MAIDQPSRNPLGMFVSVETRNLYAAKSTGFTHTSTLKGAGAANRKLGPTSMHPLLPSNVNAVPSAPGTPSCTPP